ncbi:hypothetical protein [Bradyrhizobium sp. USDA 4353]
MKPTTTLPKKLSSQRHNFRRSAERFEQRSAAAKLRPERGGRAKFACDPRHGRMPEADGPQLLVVPGKSRPPAPLAYDVAHQQQSETKQGNPGSTQKVTVPVCAFYLHFVRAYASIRGL